MNNSDTKLFNNLNEAIHAFHIIHIENEGASTHPTFRIFKVNDPAKNVTVVGPTQAAKRILKLSEEENLKAIYVHAGNGKVIKSKCTKQLVDILTKSLKRIVLRKRYTKQECQAIGVYS